MGYGYGYSGYDTGFSFVDGLFHVVLIVLIVCLIIWIVRMFAGPRGWNRRARMMDMWQSHSAMGILNERYAKGEISKEEYDERKQTLMGQSK